jgi:hypothetical protein
MDRNYAIIIPVIVGLLLLTGCSGGQQPNQLADPFIGGNLGLNLYLQNGNPPPAVYDGGKFPFSVVVVAENVGEADIGPDSENPVVTARLEGILPQNFDVANQDLTQTLTMLTTGAHKNALDGTIIGGMPTTFEFGPLNFKGKLQGNQELTVRGVVCYDYSNTATAPICVTNNALQNIQDTTLCTANGEKPVANSGGPIHVTHVTQNPISNNKTQIIFAIEHVGPGEFYGRTPKEDCNSDVRNPNKYRVDIAVSVLDPNSRLSCARLNNTNFGTIVMYSGAPQTITCTLDHSKSSSTRIYTDTMTIRTFYRYGQFIEQKMIIQAVPQ